MIFRGRQMLLTAGLVAIITTLIPFSIQAQDSLDGWRFTLVIESTDSDSVEFEGLVHDGNIRLCESVSGIETVAVLTDDGLFIMTPAIMTATEIEEMDPPSVDEVGWVEWLMEPGRINPMTFATMLELEDDYDESFEFGDGEVTALFSGGILESLSFPTPSDEGTITYTYSGFEEEGNINPADFEVPASYRITD